MILRFKGPSDTASPYESEKQKREVEKRKQEQKRATQEEEEERSRKVYSENVLRNTKNLVGVLAKNKDDLIRDGFFFSSNADIPELRAVALWESQRKNTKTYVEAMVETLIRIENSHGERWGNGFNFPAASVLVFGAPQSVYETVGVGQASVRN